MRKLIVSILSTAISLFLTAYFIHGFSVIPTINSYLLASIVLLIFNSILLPIVKLLLLPINLLTLGLFRWVGNVLVLYIFDAVYDGVRISAYNFVGYSSPYLMIPSGEVSFLWTLILSSLSLSLFYGLISGLLKADDN